MLRVVDVRDAWVRNEASYQVAFEGFWFNVSLNIGKPKSSFWMLVAKLPTS